MAGLSIFDRDLVRSSWFDAELNPLSWFDVEHAESTGQSSLVQAGFRSLFLEWIGLSSLEVQPVSLLLYKPIGRRIAPLLRF